MAGVEERVNSFVVGKNFHVDKMGLFFKVQLRTTLKGHDPVSLDAQRLVMRNWSNVSEMSCLL